MSKKKRIKLNAKEIGGYDAHIKPSYFSYWNRQQTTKFGKLLEFCKVLKINIDYLLNGTIYNDVDTQLIEKIKICSLENQNRISKIIDVFVEEEKLEK